MPRKGNRKVRTGCHTCKIRKVKCDEAKPHCVRCTSTGRRCDGYGPKSGPQGYLPVLSRACFSSPGLDEGDARAVHFFQHTAGPTLSGQLDDYFWSRLVLQLSQREPAVRHAVVAISSLYEQLQGAAKWAYPSVNNTAIRRYNAAIQRLGSIQDEAVALVTCVLFVCIEFLQGNKQSAIHHCRHGILILNTACMSSPWVRENLLPIFRRMSIFPFFFGSTVSMFPSVADLDASVPASFTSFADAQFSLDALLSRAVRFIRSGDEYRLGQLRQVTIPESLLNEQEEINNSLDDWHQAFSQFNTRRTQSDANSVELLRMRYLVTKIWVGATLERSERAFDRYINDFRSILNLASRMTQAGTHGPASHTRPKFIFEMGVLPLLYFAVIKCRSLEIRLAALSFIKDLAVDREGLWDVTTMLGVGRRVIEIEHEMSLDRLSAQGSIPGHGAVPQAEQYVWESMVMPELHTQQDGSSRVVTHRKVRFIVSRTADELKVQDEWVTVSQAQSDKECTTQENSLLSGNRKLVS